MDDLYEGLAQTLLVFAEKVKRCLPPVDKLQEVFVAIQPTLNRISTLSAITDAAEKLSEEQFVLTGTIPVELVKRADTEDIGVLAAEYLISEVRVRKTIEQCGLSQDLLFQQAIGALKNEQFNLAILGFTAVLDRLLSEYSGQVKNVNIKSRCDAIVDKIENRGDLYFDDLNGCDYLLLLTYANPIRIFGENSSFSKSEPKTLNRHWIMHGRTKKSYTRIDCVKVINMIYGTIRMGQLGEEDWNGIQA